MEIVLICRDALSNSLLGNLMFATEARKGGKDVAVIFTQEALAALCGGVFAWPNELQGQRNRVQMVARAQTMDIPISGRGEAKQVNARALLARAQESGVKTIACPLWTSLLGLEDKLPKGMEKMDHSQVMQMVIQAKTVIGSL